MDSLRPFLQGFFLPYNMSVYPGALRFAGNSPRTEYITGKSRHMCEIYLVFRRMVGGVE
jgi:hypothetical protein